MAHLFPRTLKTILLKTGQTADGDGRRRNEFVETGRRRNEFVETAGIASVPKTQHQGYPGATAPLKPKSGLNGPPAA